MELIYSDSDIVVCIKPVGMDSEKDAPEVLKEKLSGDIFAVHRLDKNVSGVMVFARTRTAAAQLSRLIQDGLMIKEYIAIVHGIPPENGDWEDLLWKDTSKNKVFIVKRMRAGVKAARLEFRRLTAGEQSMVHIRLHTGRSHQIRVQFASHGFPLVGDHKYGSRDKAVSPMLFSCCITIPYKGEERKFKALPEWGKECQKL